MLWIIPAAAASVIAGIIAANTPEKRELRATRAGFNERKKNFSSIVSCRGIYHADGIDNDVRWEDPKASKRCDIMMSVSSVLICCGEKSRSSTIDSLYMMEVFTPEMVEKSLSSSAGDPLMLKLDTYMKCRPKFRGYAKELFVLGYGRETSDCKVFYIKRGDVMVMKAMAEKYRTLNNNRKIHRTGRQS